MEWTKSNGWMRAKPNKMRKLLFSLSLFLLACANEGEMAQKAVDQAIEYHGVRTLDRDTVEFVFRDHRYIHAQDGGEFRYERHPIPDSIEYRDVLTNEGFRRYRNGELVELPSKDSTVFSESLNSVIYFAFLPYRLNDPAVLKTYQGIDSIQGNSYHQVRISFEAEKGGKDHEDVFLYWFNTEDGRMDFLAYRFFEDGGGVRFREAFDRRRIDGLLVQSYHNFKAPQDVKLRDLDEMWEKGELEKVSEIRTEKVRSP